MSGMLTDRCKRRFSVLLVIFLLVIVYRSFKEHKPLPLRKGERVLAMAISPDNSIMVFATSGSNNIRLWDIRNKTEMQPISSGGVLFNLQVTDDFKIVGLGFWPDENVRVWDMTGHLISRLKTSFTKADRIAYSYSQNIFVTAEWDSSSGKTTVALDKAGGGCPLMTFIASGNAHANISVSRDGLISVIGVSSIGSTTDSMHMTLYVIDLVELRVVSNVEMPGLPDVLELSNNGGSLAAWWKNMNMTVDILDLRTCRYVARLKSDIRAAIEDVKFIGNTDYIAIAASDQTISNIPFTRIFDNCYGEIRLWNIATKSNIQTVVLILPRV